MAVIDMVSVVARTRALANRYLVQQMGVRGLEGLVTSHGDVLLQLFAEDGLPMRELAARGVSRSLDGHHAGEKTR